MGVPCLVGSWSRGYPFADATTPYSGVGTDDHLIDVAEVAARLAVGERFVRRLVSERRIPFLKIGRHLRFQSTDVEQWIVSHRVDATGR